MKKLFFIFLCLIFAGCANKPDNGITGKEFNIAGEKVLLGGELMLGGLTDSTDFKPEVKLEKWGDEAYLKVWSEDTGDKTATQSGDKVVWNSSDGKEYNFYEKTAAEIGNEDGGFEYEIVFKSKPETNIVTLKIETKSLQFFYQDELSAEDKANGAERPENIIGSYAVFHESKQDNQYGSGKAFHIYRPEIIDNDGNKIWGEFNKDAEETGVLSITIPKEFLDKASYPVTVDPTIGYTTLGGTNQVIGVGSPNAYRYRVGHGSYSPATSGIPNKIVAGITSNYTGSNRSFSVFINEKDGSGEGSHTQIASTSLTYNVTNGSSTWREFYASGYNLMSSTGNYILSAVESSESLGTGNASYLVYDDSTEHYNYLELWIDNLTGTYESPWATSTVSGTRHYSLYVEYYPCYAGSSCNIPYAIPGLYSWTAPTGVTSANVACWGGGGGGGDGIGTGGGGGGGGAFASSTVTVTPGTTYNIYVGDRGKHYSDGAAGLKGGTSTFATTTVVAAPGWGGGGGTTASTTGGVGGAVASSTGDVVYAGGKGGDGNPSSDASGGGGGAAGPHGAGVDSAYATSTGRIGGNGDNNYGGTGGTGGNNISGVSGGSHVYGGGGGGGGDDGYYGGLGGYFGGGGGGGETNSTGYGWGGVGRCEIYYVLPSESSGTTATERQSIFFLE